MAKSKRRDLFISTGGIEIWENILKSLLTGKNFDIALIKHGDERLMCWRVCQNVWESFRNRIKSEEGRRPRFFIRYVDSEYIKEELPKSHSPLRPSGKAKTIKRMRGRMNRIR